MARFEVRQGARFNDAVGLTFSGLLAGESYFRGESLYVVHHGAGDRDVLRGRGFVYDAEGDPVGGVVTTIQPIAGGKTMGLVKGVTISFEKLMAAAESPTIRDDRALIVAEMAGSDLMLGHDRDDRFNGRGGNDRIWGRGGDDRIDGGSGHDFIVGGGGTDILKGGAGADRFRFESILDSKVSAPDRIGDFLPGRDKVDLQKIDADAITAGDQSFAFIGAAEFTGRAGELRFSGGHLYGDVNGDAQADFLVHIVAPASVQASDFML